MIRFKNNWAALTSAAITSTDTTIPISSNIASIISDASVDDPYWVTLDRGDNVWEIIHVTGVAGGNLTVLRGQEGTTALDWPIKSYMEIRITSAFLELVQNLDTELPDVVVVPTSGGITIDMTLGPKQILDADVGGLITVLTPPDPGLYYEVELWTPNWPGTAQTWSWTGVTYTSSVYGGLATNGAPNMLFAYGGQVWGKKIEYDTAWYG